ncbi:MAG TPA: OmpA family protein [Sandaracinaceae bacterium]
MRAKHTGVALMVALSAWAADVDAQRLGGQRFGPAGSEDGIFETEGADRRRVLWPYVALHLHYAWNPIVLVDDDGQTVAAPVEHLLAADLVASIAVWEGLEFGLALPVTLFSDGDRIAGVPAAPGTALGDFSLRVAYRIRLAEHTALAFHVPVLFPTNADDNMLAFGWGVRPTVAFMQRVGPVEILLNAYVLLRENPVALLDYRGGHETGARLGFRFDLSGRWQTALLLEGGFATAFEGFFQGATTPAETRIGLEHWFDEHWRISFFGGTGIGPGVGAPDFRTGAAIAFGNNVPYRPVPSETAGDRDGDGVPDRRDRCPNRAEDRDGFQDRDGCPEDDNDRDGLLDHEDQCPNEPESRDGITDSDGCPDRIRVQGTRITTFEAVHFRTGSDEILERSYPMLDEIAGVLRANPDMRVRIEGHTDSQGNDADNLRLSRARAASVRRYLIEHGVSPRQLRARGFGESRPIATNRTPRGRFLNRRVEFHIVR